MSLCVYCACVSLTESVLSMLYDLYPAVCSASGAVLHQDARCVLLMVLWASHGAGSRSVHTPWSSPECSAPCRFGKSSILRAALQTFHYVQSRCSLLPLGLGMLQIECPTGDVGERDLSHNLQSAAHVSSVRRSPCLCENHTQHERRIVHERGRAEG